MGEEGAEVILIKDIGTVTNAANNDCEVVLNNITIIGIPVIVSHAYKLMVSLLDQDQKQTTHPQQCNPPYRAVRAGKCHPSSQFCRA